MPTPSHCPNPKCANTHNPKDRWLVRHGTYISVAHGRTQRYRCSECGTCFSDQTESLHYYAKRHVPFRAIWSSLTSGASQRAIADRYHLSPQAVHNAVVRLGRQAIASQTMLLHSMSPVHSVVMDGLRSFVTSQDYPCDLTMTVESVGETILSIEHTVLRRGGRMRAHQVQRLQRKMRRWKPTPGRYTRAIDLLLNELWDYLRPPDIERPAVLHSDEHRLYRALISRHPVCTHFQRHDLFVHRTVNSRAPRTRGNPLFPANYVDLLLRHRMKEHTRETIAFARNANSQMHRAWIFAWDHNANRPYRARVPRQGPHAAQAVSGSAVIGQLKRQFYTRRIDMTTATMPESLRRVWLQKIETPPVRWLVGQTGSNVHLPRFAIHDFDRQNQQAC